MQHCMFTLSSVYQLTNRETIMVNLFKTFSTYNNHSSISTYHNTFRCLLMLAYPYYRIRQTMILYCVFLVKCQILTTTPCKTLLLRFLFVKKSHIHTVSVVSVMTWKLLHVDRLIGGGGGIQTLWIFMSRQSDNIPKSDKILQCIALILIFGYKYSLLKDSFCSVHV